MCQPGKTVGLCRPAGLFSTVNVGMLVTFIVYSAITIDVGFPDHGLHVILAQVFSQVVHRQPQLIRVDVPVAVDVEHLRKTNEIPLMSNQFPTSPKIT